MSINNSYFEWLCRLVCDRQHRQSSYRQMLQNIHLIPFIAINPLDENRGADGIELRYRFAREENRRSELIYLEIEKCSVLEMMIALAVRCEEHIMENSEIGNRTAQWFWIMVQNLGIEQTSDTYDVTRIITRLLHRDYESDGRGGLFIVDTGDDVRQIEIWYQMCLYLNNMLE
jgi:hypothetical protein